MFSVQKKQKNNPEYLVHLRSLSGAFKVGFVLVDMAGVAKSKDNLGV